MDSERTDPCQCSRCRRTFDYSEAIEKKRKLYGTEITETCCPYCKCSSIRHMKLWIDR